MDNPAGVGSGIFDGTKGLGKELAGGVTGVYKVPK